ncbi:glycosyl hydrolase [Duganella radicis]|uniref:Glycosyl hydrolase n=1 Tax=Duganella radicis TaxID=551988 RepID=A0A6L6PD56_9BURK|nr:glycosyl hydrolase [Duganella radicis]
MLARPALASAKAASSVMLAIAQAGERIVAAGERGIIVYSDDQGASWRQAAVPVSVSLVGLRFANGRDGWAVGHSGVVLRTRDGGQSWVRQLDGAGAAQRALDAAKAGQGGARALADAERLAAEGPSKPFLDVQFFDEQHGLVVGAFGLMFATADGGQHWQPAMERLDNPKGKHLYAVQARGDECYVVGELGAVYYSKDRCQAFSAVQTPYEGTYFGAVATGPRSVVVFGMRGHVYWSGDAGASWRQSEIATPASLMAGLLLKDGSILLSDETGRLFRSTDGGRRFEPAPAAQPAPTTGLLQTANGSLFLSGVRGITRAALK